MVATIASPGRRVLDAFFAMVSASDCSRFWRREERRAERRVRK